MPDFISQPATSLAAAFQVLLVADPGREVGAHAAVHAIGGRIVEQVGWTEGNRLGQRFGRPILIAEAEGIDADTLAAMLPRLDALAGTLDTRIVLVVDEAHIDLAVALIFGPRVHYLCRPTQADRVAAIAIAASLSGGSVREDGDGGDAGRFERLNAEVARIAEVLARLASGEGEGGATLADRRAGYGIAPTTEPAGIAAAEIRQMIRARRLRDQFFGDGLFEDPAWDMLLDLYAAELEGVAVSVSSLCIAAAVAPTTALRWIGRMTEAGFLERRPDPADRRRAFLALTARGREGMAGYFRALRQAGLPA